MNQLDNEFFETYKRLDKICRDMYNHSGEYKAGVKMYLEDMEENFSRGGSIIPEWEADFRALKRCKYIRDNLAHSADYPPQGMSTQKDIEFVQSFYQRIMNQTDPLAALDKLEKRSHAARVLDSYPIDRNEESDNAHNTLILVLTLVACIGIVVALILGIFFALLLPDSFL